MIVLLDAEMLRHEVAADLQGGDASAVRLQGKSHTAEVAVTLKDMPNFFIEAVTIADSRVTSTRIRSW